MTTLGHVRKIYRHNLQKQQNKFGCNARDDTT